MGVCVCVCAGSAPLWLQSRQGPGLCPFSIFLRASLCCLLLLQWFCVQCRGRGAAAPELGEGPSHVSPRCQGCPPGQRAHHPGWPASQCPPWSGLGILDLLGQEIPLVHGGSLGASPHCPVPAAQSYLISGSCLPSMISAHYWCSWLWASGRGWRGECPPRAAGPPRGYLPGMLGWTWGTRLGLIWRKGPESPGWAAPWWAPSLRPHPVSLLREEAWQHPPPALRQGPSFCHLAPGPQEAHPLPACVQR